MHFPIPHLLLPLPLPALSVFLPIYLFIYFFGVFEAGERISMPPSFLRVMEPPLGCETSCPHATRAGFSNHLLLQYRASVKKCLPLPLAWMQTEGTASPFSTPFGSFFLNTVPCLPLDLERAVNVLKIGSFSPNIFPLLVSGLYAFESLHKYGLSFHVLCTENINPRTVKLKRTP